ncbi:MAG: PAS domain S-box protein [Pseudanabaenaceae cyanobacterium bins.68]|nr:PAS domain S-box protein [Pseudanabaenaceae cyanobacterium bins.68]
MVISSEEVFPDRPTPSLEAYICNSPLAVIEWDADGRILRWTGQAENIFGWSAAEAVNQKINQSLKLVVEADFGRLQLVARQIGEPRSLVQVRNYTKANQLIHCQWYNSLVYDQATAKVTVLSLVLDVTARERSIEMAIDLQKRYEVLFNCDDDSVVVHGFLADASPDRFLEVNDAACRNLGYSRAELLQMSPRDISLPSSERSLHIANLFKNGKVVFETVHLTRAGKSIPVEVRSHLFVRDQRTLAISFARDITAHKLAQEENLIGRELFSNIFNQSTDAIFLVNAETRLIFDCNLRAIELFEASSKDDLIGIAGNTLQKSPCSVAEHRQMAEQLAATNLYRFETEYLTRRGKVFWGNAAIKRIKVAQKTVNLVRVSDITELKLKHMQLEQAQEQAHEASQAKSNFLAVMSHEIRNPLNGILSVGQLLANTGLNPEQQELVEIMQRSGEILLKVINDILDFSKIESGKLELRHDSFSLANCIDAAVKLNLAQAQRQGIVLDSQIDPSCPRFLLGDTQRLSQVLINLISNGIKFTQVGGVHVKVTSELVQPQSRLHQLQFEVRDTGIGIPPEQADRLFRNFSQINVGSNYGGTGLGLVICRSLCELMGGKIWFESELGVGSVFYFTIQARELELMPAQAVQPERSLPPDLRILLVEDNQVNIRLAQKMLSRLGYNTDLAVNGLEAVAAVRSKTYDLVFMDILMPELDGLEATRKICTELPTNSQPWIIAMTANAMAEDREACLAAGMKDHVSKPISLEAIAAAIQRWYAAQG